MIALIFGGCVVIALGIGAVLWFCAQTAPEPSREDDWQQ